MRPCFPILLILLLAAPLSLAAAPIEVNAGFRAEALGRQLQYLHDPSGALDLPAVRSPERADDWRPIEQDRVNFSYTPDAYWLRFELNDAAGVDHELLLELVSLIDQIDLYLLRNGAVERRSFGRWAPLSGRDIIHRNFLFRMPLRAGERLVVYMRFQSEGALLIPLTLYSWEVFALKDREEQIAFGHFFGVILVMAFYNLFIYFTVRDRSYLYYVLYIFGFGMIFSGMWGFTHEYLAPDWPWAANRSIPLAIGFSSFFALQFARVFLDSRRQGRVLHYLVVALSALTALHTIASLFASYALVIRVGLVLALATSFYLFALSLVALLRGYRPARFFFLAFVVLILGVIVVVLRNFGILPFHWAVNYSAQIGSALEVTLLSIALGDRINAMRRERAELQRQALERQRELTNAFARFVPEQFLTFLGKADITAVGAGDAVQRRMTVLFSDIRSFTSIVERMSPEESFAFINEYLGRMGPVIRAHRGFIDKYIGDAIMALFPESPGDAVQAALAMRRELRRYNAERLASGRPAIDIGIGIHTGVLMLGTVGESERLENTVISDDVNLASRLETLTKKLHSPIVVSETVMLEGGNSGLFRALGKVRVKGKEEAVGVYEVIEGDGDGASGSAP